MVSRFLHKHLFLWFEVFWDYEEVLLRHKYGEIFASQKVVLLSKTRDDWGVVSLRNFNWDIYNLFKIQQVINHDEKKPKFKRLHTLCWLERILLG